MATQPRLQPAAPRPAGPVTDRDKARALLAMLGADAPTGTPSVPQDGTAPIPPADLRAIARDLIAEVERKRAAAAPQPASKPAPGASRPDHRNPSPSAKAPALLPPRAAPPPPTETSVDVPGPAEIPEEAPGTAEAEAPPLLLSDRQMILPTFAAARRPTAGDTTAPPALFSKRAPLTLSVPRGEDHAGRLTLSSPSGFVAEERSVARIVSPALGRAHLKSLVARTVKPHRLGAEHPAIAALTLEGLPALDQAAVLRKLPHGQRRRIHRALRQVEAAMA